MIERCVEDHKTSWQKKIINYNLFLLASIWFISSANNYRVQYFTRRNHIDVGNIAKLAIVAFDKLVHLEIETPWARVLLMEIDINANNKFSINYCTASEWLPKHNFILDSVEERTAIAMKFLGVKLAINLVFCYFSGILGSTELQTIRIPPHATTNSRYFISFLFWLKCAQ